MNRARRYADKAAVSAAEARHRVEYIDDLKGRVLELEDHVAQCRKDHESTKAELDTLRKQVERATP